MSVVIAEGRVWGLPLPLQVRRATWADYREILGVDAAVGAYDAGDYLHGKLDIYLNDPDRICYIAVYDGKVIGFTMNRTVSGGEDIIGRLARLHRSMRVSGAWEFIRAVSAKHVTASRPTARYIYGCTSSYTTVPTFYSSGFDIVMVRDYVHITVNTKQSYYPVALPPDVIVENLTTSGLYALLSDRKLHWKLFPHGFAVIGREPLKIRPDNFRFITEECKYITSSYDVTSGEIRTLSFGTGFHSPQGYIYEIDIYTGTGNDAELTRHVMEHLPVARRHVTQEQTLKLTVFVCNKYGVKGIISKVSFVSGEGDFSFSDISHHTLGRVGVKNYIGYLDKTTNFTIKSSL